MSISGKTAAPFEQPFLLSGDKPTDAPALTKAIADKTHANLATVSAEAVGSNRLKPVAGLKSASADLALSSSYADIPGASLELTPVVLSILKVTAVFDFEIGTNNPSESTCEGTISVDGVAQARAAHHAFQGVSTSAGATLRDTVSQVYAVPLAAGEKHVIKLVARRFSGSSSSKTYSAHTAFLYELIAS